MTDRPICGYDQETLCPHWEAWAKYQGASDFTKICRICVQHKLIKELARMRASLPSS